MQNGTFGGAKMAQLTATGIKNAKSDEKDYRIHDGNGLYLLVRKTGKKTFLYHVRKPKDTFHTIGNFPTVSLADARAYVANFTKKKELEDSALNRPGYFRHPLGS